MNKQRFIKATDEGSGKIHWINPIYIHEVVELGDGMWRLYRVVQHLSFTR